MIELKEGKRRGALTRFTSRGRICRHRLQFFRPIRGRTCPFDSKSRRKRPLRCRADAKRSFVSCAIPVASPVCTPDTDPFKKKKWARKKKGRQFNGNVLLDRESQKKKRMKERNALTNLANPTNDVLQDAELD